MYTILDLSRLTFKLDESDEQALEYDAENAPDDVFAAYAQSLANIKGSVDWSDLEERAHFFTKLFLFCQAQQFDLPYHENLPDEERKNLPG
jgi:hypothetical protein